MWDLNKDSGLGELNLRAYVAGITGPRRVSHGNKAVKQVPLTGSVGLARNNARSNQVMYVACLLNMSNGGGAIRMRFAGDEAIGDNSIAVLLGNLTAGRQFDFEAILLPGEQLYAQAADAPGPGLVVVPLVVSVVTV